MASETATHDLVSLAWAGNELRADDIQTNIENVLVTTEWANVPGVGHQDMGRGPIVTSATLWFLNSDRPGSFPGYARKVLATLMNGTIAELMHPLIGKMKARCKGPDFLITTKVQNGLKMNVTWEESIESASQPTKINLTGSASKAAKDADAGMSSMGLDYPDGSSDTSFEGMVNQIKNFGSTVAFEVENSIFKTVNTIDQVHEAIDANANLEVNLPRNLRTTASHPARAGLQISLCLLRSALVEMAKTAAKSGDNVAELVLVKPGTLPGLSLSLKVDIGKLIKLNPKLPLLVPAGTTVKYPKAA